MKKLLIVSAVAAALSANAQAQESNTENNMWFAGFGEYYSTDHAETGFPHYLDNGYGFGVEFGYKFTPEWAARLEYSSQNIDSGRSPATSDDESGRRAGADLMYFMPNFYVFGGVKYVEIFNDDTVANFGLGKHWNTESDVKIITEVAAYTDVGDNSNTHMGFKVGLSYEFGGKPTTTRNRDSDNDGVVDGQDNCQYTAAGARVDANGCEIVVEAMPQNADQDKDGVMDAQDNCANTPMEDKVDANGCSVFVEEEYTTNLRVLFAHDSAVISNPDDSQFQEFADFMKRYPSTDTVIEGHASAPGPEDYNMDLSKRRADAVRELLITKYGISGDRLTTKGYGETQLLDPSNTAEANRINRRSVVTAKISTREKVKVAR